MWVESDFTAVGIHLLECPSIGNVSVESQRRLVAGECTFRVLSSFTEGTCRCKDSSALGDGLLQLLIAVDHYLRALNDQSDAGTVTAPLRKRK